VGTGSGSSRPESVLFTLALRLRISRLDNRQGIEHLGGHLGRNKAIARYKQSVVTVPVVSFESKGLQPAPTLDEYMAWLEPENLFDPLLNPRQNRENDQKTANRRLS
jgi:hypothetical protein